MPIGLIPIIIFVVLVIPFVALGRRGWFKRPQVKVAFWSLAAVVLIVAIVLLALGR